MSAQDHTADADDTAQMLTEAAEALLADVATPTAAREALAQRRPDLRAWQALDEAGFLRALLPEAAGGAGLRWTDVLGLCQAIGRHAPVAPLAEALLAQALAAAAGIALPEGTITAGPAGITTNEVTARALPWGDGAEWALVWGNDGACLLLPVAAAQATAHPGLGGSAEADLVWANPEPQSTGPLPAGWDASAMLTALRCAQMAGALEAVLSLTLQHSADRRQFGRAIGQFQAVQQQMAVLAEDVFATRMAAALACRGVDAALGGAPDTAAMAADVGAAKCVASEAAARACATAHAVHGAMGITAEHDLQLHTKRLLAWRMQQGSEVFWAAQLGRALLADRRLVWDAVRQASAD